MGVTVRFLQLVDLEEKRGIKLPILTGKNFIITFQYKVPKVSNLISDTELGSYFELGKDRLLKMIDDSKS